MGYTTLEALKSFGGFEDDSEDVILDVLIQSATEIINDQTGRVFEIEEETERYFTRHRGIPSRFEGNKLHLDMDLAAAASHITDTPTVVYLPENDPPYHAIVIVDGAWHPEEVIINGFWGYSKTPPSAIEIACLRLSKWLYDMRDTTTGAAVVITPEGKVLLPQGLPSDVVTILKPYMKLVVV